MKVGESLLIKALKQPSSLRILLLAVPSWDAMVSQGCWNKIPWTLNIVPAVTCLTLQAARSFSLKCHCPFDILGSILPGVWTELPIFGAPYCHSIASSPASVTSGLHSELFLSSCKGFSLNWLWDHPSSGWRLFYLMYLFDNNHIYKEVGHLSSEFRFYSFSLSPDGYKYVLGKREIGLDQWFSNCGSLCFWSQMIA